MTIQKLTIQIIVENTSGPSGTLGEGGFSALVETESSDEEFKILFDTGPSPVAFLNNVKNLEIDLNSIDVIVLSHGHWDHVGGLKEAIANIQKKTPVICHPQALSPKWFVDKKEVIDVGIQGFFNSSEELSSLTDLILTKSPYKLTESIMTTGEVPRLNEYEKLAGKLKDIKTLEDGKEIPDYIVDDLSLVFHLADDSVVILAGCCHSGIINTITKAKELTKSSNIVGIIGGLHLHDASTTRINKTVQELKKFPLKVLAPCHCTGFKGKFELFNAFKDEYKDTTVSSVIKIEVNG
jgi:7,8-dihydropterin-6-yl-methyl-4-(beta-D-ribofuranosyl)aminobenzene 5'-phosphate synthase